jgi:hypothetical protein
LAGRSPRGPSALLSTLDDHLLAGVAFDLADVVDGLLERD